MTRQDQQLWAVLKPTCAANRPSWRRCHWPGSRARARL